MTDDCGAACIGMILNNYFNKNMSLCEIRPLIKNTINGTSFGDIKNNINKFLANWIPCIVQIDIESSTANLAIEENFMKLYYAKLLNGLTVKVLIVLISTYSFFTFNYFTYTGIVFSIHVQCLL